MNWQLNDYDQEYEEDKYDESSIDQTRFHISQYDDQRDVRNSLNW